MFFSNRQRRERACPTIVQRFEQKTRLQLSAPVVAMFFVPFSFFLCRVLSGLLFHLSCFVLSRRPVSSACLIRPTSGLSSRQFCSLHCDTLSCRALLVTFGWNFVGFCCVFVSSFFLSPVLSPFLSPFILLFSSPFSLLFLMSFLFLFVVLCLVISLLLAVLSAS